MPKNFSLASTVMLVFCILSGCTDDKTVTDAKAQKAFVILVDRSASISTTQLSAYLTYLKHYVLPSIPPGAHVLVQPIAGDNSRNPPPETVVTVDLPTLTPFHKGFLYYILYGDTSEDKACADRTKGELKKFEEARGRLEKAIEAQVFSPELHSRKTFIIAAMRSASDYLQERPGRRVVVTFSDALEDSDGGSDELENISFADPTFWGRRSTQLVSRLHPRRAFPGLHGANVTFFGMGGNRLHDKVRSFWGTFFEAAGVTKVSLSQPPLYTEQAYLAMPASEENLREKTSEVCK